MVLNFERSCGHQVQIPIVGNQPKKVLLCVPYVNCRNIRVTLLDHVSGEQTADAVLSTFAFCSTESAKKVVYTFYTSHRNMGWLFSIPRLRAASRHIA